eukprot:Nitzschia sp. Nitz4//scaffold17_size182527//171565//172365//NITZ4_001883-RA/size182527-processed-gene-0.76-mRNA-1//-1//CDS//3329539427//8568//frame0
MNPSAPKENANPTILSVDKRHIHTKQSQLDWTQVGDFILEDGDSTALQNWFPTSSQDMAIISALVDISKATHGQGVGLLGRAGLKVPVQAPNSDRGLNWRPTILIQEGSKETTDSPAIETAETSSISYEPIDAEEVFHIIRTIQDPEHPHTLEQLGVVSLDQIQVTDPHPSNATNSLSIVHVRFTPTIPHCSMATLIGLCLTVKLRRSLPARFKISVQIEPGTHVSEKAINKQLRDKERVCAALENQHLANVVHKCIRNGMQHFAQ